MSPAPAGSGPGAAGGSGRDRVKVAGRAGQAAARGPHHPERAGQVHANAAAVLPLRLPGLRVFATVVWALAATTLIALILAWSVHWTRYPERARGHAANPVMAQFWGAPAMALMTVGAGTLVLGGGLIGPAAAVSADWVLWLAGTGLGLVTACWIPYLMMTRHVIGGVLRSRRNLRHRHHRLGRP